MEARRAVGTKPGQDSRWLTIQLRTSQDFVAVPCFAIPGVSATVRDMPDPSRYNRSTWENQKRLLKAHDDWVRTKKDGAMVGLALFGLGGAVLFVVCVVGWFVAMFFR